MKLRNVKRYLLEVHPKKENLSIACRYLTGHRRPGGLRMLLIQWNFSWQKLWNSYIKNKERLLNIWRRGTEAFLSYAINMCAVCLTLETSAFDKGYPQ